MTFGGIPYEDDWLVMWRGLNIGRILKQSGLTMGALTWFWGTMSRECPSPHAGRAMGRTWLTASASSRGRGRPSVPD